MNALENLTLPNGHCRYIFFRAFILQKSFMIAVFITLSRQTCTTYLFKRRALLWPSAKARGRNSIATRRGSFVQSFSPYPAFKSCYFVRISLTHISSVPTRQKRTNDQDFRAAFSWVSLLKSPLLSHKTVYRKHKKNQYVNGTATSWAFKGRLQRFTQIYVRLYFSSDKSRSLLWRNLASLREYGRPAQVTVGTWISTKGHP